jgi:hypothetical protein
MTHANAAAHPGDSHRWEDCMDIEGLARAAVDTVARHLVNRGTDAAGRLANAGVDRVFQLIAGRLHAHPAGRQALDSLLGDPGDPGGQEWAADLVAQEAEADPRFAGALDGAARQAGIVVQGAGARYRVGSDYRFENRDDNRVYYQGIRGGRDVKIKHRQFRIGRLQFGTGGLVSGIALLVLALGGGTAAIVAGETVSLSSAVGRWERPGEKLVDGIETGPAVLTVDDKGAFTFTMDMRVSLPGGQTPAGFPSMNLNCAGTTEAAGDHFTMRSTTGQCGTFDAKLSSDGRVIDLFLAAEGTSSGSLSLTKAAG